MASTTTKPRGLKRQIQTKWFDYMPKFLLQKKEYDKNTYYDPNTKRQEPLAVCA